MHFYVIFSYILESLHYLCRWKHKTKSIMKKITLLLLSVLCISTGVFADNPKELEKETIPVTIKGDLPIQPRSVNIVSMVDCYYCDGRLYVDFYENLGDVTISVTDTSTGELYSTYGAGIMQSFYLDVPSVAGDYYVEIEVGTSLLYGYYNL